MHVHVIVHVYVHDSMCIMYILWPEQHVHVNVHVYVHVHHVHPLAWNHETLLGGH